MSRKFDKKKIFVTIFKLGVSVGILYFLFYVINIYNLVESFNQVRIITILMVGIGYFVIDYIGVKRWQVILRNVKIDVSDKDLYVSYLVGAFFNNFLPSSIGGDISKVFTVKIKEEDRILFGGTVVAERLAGMINGLFWGVLTGSLYLSKADEILLLWLFLLLCLFLLLVLILFRKRIKVSRFFSLLPAGYKQVYKDFVGRISHFQIDWDDIIKIFIYSTLSLFVSLFTTNLFLIDLGYPVMVAPIIFMISAVMMISLIPVSLNAFGVREVGFVAILGLFRVKSYDALLIGLVSRVVLILCSLVGGVLLLLNKSTKDKVE